MAADFFVGNDICICTNNRTSKYLTKGNVNLY